MIATSEAVPYAKTGGLADVTGSLLREYLRLGEEAYLFLPLYRTVRNNFVVRSSGISINIRLGERLIKGQVFSIDDRVFLIECDEFFDRDELYGTPHGDFPDNAQRFIFFSKAIIESLMTMGLRPDIIHCNDWQTAMIPLYLKTLYKDYFRQTATVMTIHNMGYQGVFDSSLMNLTGLGWEWFNMEGIEFYGKINFLKAGLISADIITTVSNQYAKEILTSEYGHALDGVLRKRAKDIRGILNGIDTEEWNPATDRFLPQRFNHHDSGKKICKDELIKECRLTIDKEAPIISFIGRLSRQKGIDILSESIESIVSLGPGIIILGKGDAEFEDKVKRSGESYKGKVYVRIGYDEPFAHRVYAGSDIFVMPSRYEPCGLGQMIAMRYGTIPVARKTGGIVDTIEDYNPLTNSGTGFLFEGFSSDAMLCSIRLAISAFGCKDRWIGLIKRAMEKDFSWKRSATEYIDLYESLIKERL
ncbi:MAG: glycogen synthase GlgA [Thermodesulfovibrionales bacterium]